MKKRETELDILRFSALFFVVLMHSSGNQNINAALDSKHFSAFVAAIVWCVPAFVMISGRIFLDPTKTVTIPVIFSKYLLRIISAFIVWTGVYVIYYILSGTYNNLNIFGIAHQFIYGPYHFWYLYMLAGLYLTTPFLRKIAHDDQLCIYFLILFAILNIITGYLVYLPKIGSIIAEAMERLNLHLVIGYAGYFVLGYFIYKNRDRISPRLEAIIYIGGILLLCTTCIVEDHLSEELQSQDFVKQYMKPNIVAISAALFVFFEKRISRINFTEKTRHLFTRLTELGFGAYAIHALVICLLSYIPLPTAAQYPYISLFLLTAVTVLLSLLATALLRKIPYIGKKIT